jgi:hypothetical protein
MAHLKAGNNHQWDVSAQLATGVRIRSAHCLVTSKFLSPWVHLRVRFGAEEIISA